MLVASRGYPQIYYGTEVMLDGIPGNYEGHRFDFPGGWAGDKHNAFNADTRTVKENEIFNYLKALLHYRKANPVLQSGKMKQFIPENGVYVFFRYNSTKTVMVVCNNNENENVLSTDRFTEATKSFVSGTDIISGKTVDIQNTVTIPGKTVLILELH